MSPWETMWHTGQAIHGTNLRFYSSLSGKAKDRQVKTCGLLRTLCVFKDCCATSRGPVGMPRICSSKSYQRKGQHGGDMHLGCPFQNTAGPVTHLAPVPHSPAGTGTEVAPLSGVGLLDSGTVRVPAGAAFHASPVGPQPTAGGALRRGGGQRGQRLRVSFSDMPHHILQSEEFCLGGSPRCRTFDKNTSAGGLP